MPAGSAMQFARERFSTTPAGDHLCVLEDFDNSSCRIFALLLRVNQAFSVTTKSFSLWVITGGILAKVQMPSAMFAEHLH